MSDCSFKNAAVILIPFTAASLTSLFPANQMWIVGTVYAISIYLLSAIYAQLIKKKDKKEAWTKSLVFFGIFIVFAFAQFIPGAGPVLSRVLPFIFTSTLGSLLIAMFYFWLFHKLL
jgi:hypothetical protein